MFWLDTTQCSNDYFEVHICSNSIRLLIQSVLCKCTQFNFCSRTNIAIIVKKINPLMMCLREFRNIAFNIGTNNTGCTLFSVTLASCLRSRLSVSKSDAKLYKIFLCYELLHHEVIPYLFRLLLKYVFYINLSYSLLPFISL